MKKVFQELWTKSIGNKSYFWFHPIHNDEILELFNEIIYHNNTDESNPLIEKLGELFSVSDLTPDDILDSLFELNDALLIAKLNDHEDFLFVKKYRKNIVNLIKQISTTNFTSYDSLHNEKYILEMMVKGMQNIGEGVLLIQPDDFGKVLFVNNALLSLTQFSHDEIVGHSFMDLVGVYKTSELENEIFPAAYEVGWKGEVTLEKANGLPFVAMLNLQPMFEEGGSTLLAMVAIIRDISKEKRHLRETEIREAQITQHNAKLRMLEDLARMINSTLDYKETLMYFNKCLKQIFPLRSFGFFLPMYAEEPTFRIAYSLNDTVEPINYTNILMKLDLEKLNDSKKVGFYLTLHQHQFPNHPHFRKLKQIGINNVTLFPIRFRDDLLGILCVGFDNFFEILNDNKKFLQQIIRHLTVAIKNCIHFDQLERQNRKLEFFYNLFSLIKSTTDRDSILKDALKNIALKFGYDHLALYRKPEGEYWERQNIHSLEEVADILLPIRMPDHKDIGKNPLQINSAIDPSESLPASNSNLSPKTILRLRDSSPLFGEVLLIGLCDDHLPDLSHDSHIDLMRNVLKELILAMNHVILFYQTTEAEQEWKMTFDQVQIALAVVDNKFNIQRANKAFYHIFSDQAKEEFKNCSELFELKPHYKALLLENDFANAFPSIEWTHNDQTLSRQFFPRFDKFGKFTSGIFTIQNITIQRKQEENIRYLSRFPEVNPNIVMSLNFEGNVQYVNKATEKLIKDLEIEDYIGLLPFELIFDIKNQKFVKGEPRIYIFKVKEESIQYVAFAPENSETIYLYGLSITEREELQDKLLLTERSRTIGEVAAGAAHDFNNYLTTILGRIDLLKMRVKDQMILKELTITEKAALDGAEMARRLQDLNRNKSNNKMEALTLSNLLTDSIMFSLQKLKPNNQVKGNKTQIRKKLDDSIVVYGNQVEYREVFTNLIFNAADAMQQGGKIHIVTTTDPTTNTAIIRVKDNGHGIPDEIIKKIYKPFFTTKGNKGTGLGLSVVNRIVQSYNGKISVESEKGKGTTFELRFPLSDEQPSESSTDTKPAIAISPNRKKTLTTRILLVDDEPDLLATVEEVLGMSYKNIEVAIGGAEALKKFSESTFHIMITDLGMPEMNGWELSSQIRKISPQTKIVLATGWGAHAKAEYEKHKSYVDSVISKPYDFQSLLQLIQEITKE